MKIQHEYRKTYYSFEFLWLWCIVQSQPIETGSKNDARISALMSLSSLATVLPTVTRLRRRSCRSPVPPHSDLPAMSCAIFWREIWSTFDRSLSLLSGEFWHVTDLQTRHARWVGCWMSSYHRIFFCYCFLPTRLILRFFHWNIFKMLQAVVTDCIFSTKTKTEVQ